MIPQHTYIRVLIVLLLLFAYFPALFPEMSDRTQPPIYEDYEAYIGETVYDLNGRVLATDPVRIAVAGGKLRLTVRNVNTAVKVGDKIRIYGVVKPDFTIRAENVIVAASNTNQLRTYIVSFLGGLWVLIRIIRDWTIDWQQWALKPTGAED